MWRKDQCKAPQIMVILAMVGLAVGFYDSYALYNAQPLWCPPPINGCNEVANSSYAQILGMPVGYYAVAYYAYMIGLAVLLTFDPVSHVLRSAALGYSASGLCFSIYFVYLQVSFIHAFCIYCLISGLLTLLLFLLALRHFRMNTRIITERQPLPG